MIQYEWGGGGEPLKGSHLFEDLCINTKITLKWALQKKGEYLNCIQLSKDKVQCRLIQTLLTNLQILLHEQNFLIGSITVRYSMKFSWQYYQNTNISVHALWISVKSFQSAMCKTLFYRIRALRWHLPIMLH